MHSQQGEKFGHEMACCIHLESFGGVSNEKWAGAFSQVVIGLTGVGTGLTGLTGCTVGMVIGLTGAWTGLTGVS